MPLHPNVHRCTHITVTGHQCGSAALKHEHFCYFHTRMIKGVQTRVDSQINPIALIENAEAIQTAIMHTIDAILKGAIDNKRANLVLRALYIAVRNSRNVYFHIRPDDMVTEVPNYAAQYLIEHPEAPQENDPAARRRSVPQATAPAKSKHPASAARTSTAAATPPQTPEKTRQSRPPLTTTQIQQTDELKKLEASIEGAARGDWRHLRTVFKAAGLAPQNKTRKHTPKSFKASEIPLTKEVNN